MATHSRRIQVSELAFKLVSYANNSTCGLYFLQVRSLVLLGQQDVFMSAFALFEDNSQESQTTLELVLNRLFDNLPEKPYCSDGFEWGLGTKIRNKKEAITKPYIQLNHPMWKKYIILDIDNPGAVVDWMYENPHLPAPNIVIENKKNGRAHFVYELLDAVSFTNKSSLKAQNYFKAVERALTNAFDADERYNGVICKNPLSSKWRVSSFKEEPYHLKELADKLELESIPFIRPIMSNEHQKSANDEDVICGRNDEVFHTVRKLAYRDVKDFKDKAGQLFDHWLNHVLELVKNKNAVFTKPMDCKECLHIAKSISKFCWKKHEECVQRFSEKQAIRGSKGGIKRSLKYDDIRAKAKKLYRAGEKVKDIAEKLNVSVRSIQRYTKGLKRLTLLSIQDINKYRAAIAEKSMRQCPNQVVAALGGALEYLPTLMGTLSYSLNIFEDINLSIHSYKYMNKRILHRLFIKDKAEPS